MVVIQQILLFFHLNLQLLKPEVVVGILSSKHNKNEFIKRKAEDDRLMFIFFFSDYLYPFNSYITYEQNVNSKCSFRIFVCFQIFF